MAALEEKCLVLFVEKYFWGVQDKTSPVLPGLWNPISNEEGGHTYVVTRI